MIMKLVIRLIMYCGVCYSGIIIKKKFQDCPTSYGLGASGGSLIQIEEMPILSSLILVKESGGISLHTYKKSFCFF